MQISNELCLALNGVHYDICSNSYNTDLQRMLRQHSEPNNFSLNFQMHCNDLSHGQVSSNEPIKYSKHFLAQHDLCDFTNSLLK